MNTNQCYQQRTWYKQTEGPKFVTTNNKKQAYIDFIDGTEICALDLRKQGKYSQRVIFLDSA